jgi:preprotein translocase subunit SecE
MKVLKTFNKASQILTILAALAAIVFFFFGFASVTADGVKHVLTGAEMCFKGSEEVAGEMVKLARSADVFFCFFLALLGLVFSALTFKNKGMRYASPLFTLASGIYMLVIALSKPVYFVDLRPLVNIDYSSLTYELGVWGITISLLVAAVLGVAHLLLDDKIIVSESKGKYTIPQRVVRFFKDYKSETKKIVWPTLKTVCRNTLIVFAICAIFGVFIWAVDFGLGELLTVLFKQ